MGICFREGGRWAFGGSLGGGGGVLGHRFWELWGAVLGVWVVLSAGIWRSFIALAGWGVVLSTATSCARGILPSSSLIIALF